jgi:tetratricopeptide (TPR) repeat protein
MRVLSALSALLLASSLIAGSPWEDLLQRRRSGDPQGGRWLLCVRPGDFSNIAAFNDPVFQRLLTAGDFALESLAAPVAQDLWHRKGWGGEAHWLLVSPSGEEAAQGSGHPLGEEVLDRIHTAGGKPRFEAREEFLRQHPDQGEAQLEQLGQAFQVLRVRLQALDRAGKVRVPAWHPEPGARTPYTPTRISLAPGSQGEAMADELYAEAADAFEKLISLPGWEQEAGAAASYLSYWDVGQSPRMRRLCAQAARDLEQQLRQDPYNADLANFWVEVSDAAGTPLDDLSGLAVPVPGEPWPDPEMVGRFVEPSIRRRDWNGALKLLSELSPQAPPEPVTSFGWEAYCRLQGTIQAQRALALAGLGSWDLAGSALAEARRWGGSNEVREVLLTRGSLFTGPGGDPQAWRQLLSQALGKDGEPPAMPPARPPLRLVVGGMPPWIVAWSGLRTAPELASWSPAELRWEVADARAHEQRRARHGWGPGPRWALYQGEDLLASGASCPASQALAGILEAAGTPMLQRLDRIVQAQPGHLAARRDRYDLLLRRMPDRRLEPTLAEDAARILTTLEFEPGAPWKPDRDLWAAAAQQALPQLEQAIRTWPNRTYLWSAWISWARFHPAQPSVLALAQGTAFWSPRGDWRAWLPYDVQRAVAAELRRQGQFSAMRDWFRGIWERLDHRPLASLHRGEREWVLKRRREEETAVFQPLRDALAALGQNEELAELERVFGEMMGRVPNRRK